jgi:hypothetical protein
MYLCVSYVMKVLSHIHTYTHTHIHTYTHTHIHTYTHTQYAEQIADSPKFSFYRIGIY